MAISESQLETWSRQGATAQFTATYETLRAVLNDVSSPYYMKSFDIFLQGSYKNDTNVYADSDVDVVVRLDSIFYSDLDLLSPEDRARHDQRRTPGDYSLREFKSAVVGWLAQKYGTDVIPGEKAIFIKGNGGRRDADVLVCAKLRRYLSYPAYGEPTYVDGICFFLPNGTRIENFPEKHSVNCTTKHQASRKWFKHTVRIFKNLRNTLIDRGRIPDGLAPSYFIEGLLYNVLNDKYGGTEQQNFVDVLTWLLAVDRNNFVCANEQFYLLRHGPMTWAPENCERFLSAAKAYWDEA